MVAEEARVPGDVDNEHKTAVPYGDAGPEAIPGPDDKFQRAIAAWRGAYDISSPMLQQPRNAFAGIDLSTLVSKLDSTASEVVAHQRDSLTQRKDLAQKTKDFRKLDDAGKLGEYKGLLKGMGMAHQESELGLTSYSVSDIHRPAYQPRKDFIFRLSSAIFVAF
ncbi:hypothetical protein GJ744_005534 [Endocarpon pusillum]|uniref:Cux N-terminal domain-containing protein n=1 Tax=Endocarpon pusillum TaxID=364733 RepID=A0A8H7E7E3_9EURO|nr:hypothetical protein GJ744_005534 [Endocarpon pusillum]